MKGPGPRTGVVYNPGAHRTCNGQAVRYGLVNALWLKCKTTSFKVAAPPQRRRSTSDVRLGCVPVAGRGHERAAGRWP